MTCGRPGFRFETALRGTVSSRSLVFSEISGFPKRIVRGGRRDRIQFAPRPKPERALGADADYERNDGVIESIATLRSRWQTALWEQLVVASLRDAHS